MAAASILSSTKLPHLGDGLVDRIAFLRADLRIGKHEVRVEMAEEERLGEAELFLVGEEKLLGLFLAIRSLTKQDDSTPAYCCWKDCTRPTAIPAICCTTTSST